MRNDLSAEWSPPPSWRVVTTIDAHAAGEPLRVIASGLPEIPGDTILAKRRWAREHLDEFRRGLMWEPRGHADMYGAILTEPVTPDGEFGVLFCHNEGFSTMCGHGIIALVTVVLETGLLDREGDRPVVRIDTPAGRVTATAYRAGGRVKEVSFLNVPSFVYARDGTVEVPGIGPVRYDIAFGGAFYALCRAEEVGCGLGPGDFRKLIDVGMRIKRAVMESHPVEHPFEEDLGFLYGTILVGAPEEPAHHSRNVCIFADGEVDRSPTGTGVSARAALEFARGELAPGEKITIESVIGSTFTVSVNETDPCGPYPAVIPEVTGSASVIGRSEWMFDPDDPFRDGFLLR